MKLVLSAVCVFLCIGLVLAREMLSRFGMESNYLMIAVLAVLLTALLAGRSLVLMGMVLMLSIVLNLPPDTLGSVAIDQDLLLAALIGVIILPMVHRLLLR
jgi:hypothetical protein